MARSCNCTDSCSCVILAGPNVAVTGTGTQANPYVVSAESLRTLIEVGDSPSLDLTLTGDGTDVDPYVISGVVTIALQGLSDVESGTPDTGDVPTWDGTQWTYSPPSVPPGQVTAGDGLAGDGSIPNPLRVRTSGEWGTAPLDTGNQDDGLLVYLDSTGALRAQQPPPVQWSAIQGIPAGVGRVIWVSTNSPTSGDGANGDVWIEY